MNYFRLTFKSGMAMALLMTAIAFGACTSAEKSGEADEIAKLSKEELISRGKYLVSTSACHDCHSPKIFTEHGPILDTTRLLSGHPSDEPLPSVPESREWVYFTGGLTAAVGEWGASFAANLTPDETGTGSWSFEQFETAIRKGKYKGLEGSRSLLPPMPWEVYRNMTDQDLRAIFAYIQSIKPVHNIVHAPIAPEDVRVRTASAK